MADRSTQTAAAAARVSQTLMIAPKSGPSRAMSFTRTPAHVRKAQATTGPEQFQQVGTSGLRQYGGFVLEEWLRQLAGRQAAWAYREMMDNSPIIGAVLFAIEWMARQMKWPVEAGQDPGAAEFVEECQHDMDCSWGDFVTDALSMLAYGWSFHETVFKRRQGYKQMPARPGENYADTQEAYWPASSAYTDGKIGWRAFPVRAQETLLRWEFLGYGTVSAMVQLDWHGGQHIIPVQKGLLFRSRPRRGNPEGYSILRPAYVSYYLLKNIQQFEAIGIERDLAGLPRLKPPPGVDLWAPGMEQMLQRAQDFVSSVRRDEFEGVVLPTAEWEFDLINAGGARQIDTNAVVMRLEQRIATSMLADFLLLGQQQVGSFALADIKSDLFGVALDGIMDLICEVLNENAVIPLLRLNGMDVTDPPRITHTSATQMDLEKVGAFLYQLSGAGAPIPWSLALLQRLFEEAGLPTNFEEAAKEPVPEVEKPDDDPAAGLVPVGPGMPPPGTDPFAREAHYEPAAAQPTPPADAAKLQKADTSQVAQGTVHHLAPLLHARQQQLAAQLEREINTALAQLGEEAATAYSHVAVKAGSPQVRALVNRVMTRLHLKQWIDSKLTPIFRNHAARVAADTQRLVQQQVGIEIHVGEDAVKRIADAGGTGLGLRDVEPQVRAAIMEAIKAGQQAGEHPTRIARRIRDQVPAGRFVNAGPAYRSKLIARTETAEMQRKATLAAYRSNPRIGHVEVSDGILADSDEACKARDGDMVPIDEADGIQPYHPQCTLSLSPVVGAPARAREPQLVAKMSEGWLRGEMEGHELWRERGEQAWDAKAALDAYAHTGNDARPKDDAAMFTVPAEMVHAARGDVRQPAATRQDLYAAAAGAKPGFDHILADAASRVSGAQSVTAPLKGVARATEKVEGRYEGDWGLIKDVVRGTVTVPKEADIGDALQAIHHAATAAGWTIHKLENRFAEDGGPVNRGATENGYRDVSMNLVSPAGFVTELQVNTEPMMAAKESAHQLYEQTRALDERGNLTDAEQAMVDAKGAQMRDIFARGWAAGR